MDRIQGMFSRFLILLFAAGQICTAVAAPLSPAPTASSRPTACMAQSAWRLAARRQGKMRLRITIWVIRTSRPSPKSMRMRRLRPRENSFSLTWKSWIQRSRNKPLLLQFLLTSRKQNWKNWKYCKRRRTVTRNASNWLLTQSLNWNRWRIIQSCTKLTWIRRYSPDLFLG